jgi:hypothetical protein
MEETKFKSPEYHFNQWVGYGRLSRDAQPAANGQPYVWLEVWVNTQMPGKNGQPGGWKEQFVRCQRWNPSEDFLKWAKRNRKVFIVGRLEGYRDDTGRIQMQVNVDTFRYLDSPGSIQNGQVETDRDLAEQSQRLEQQNAGLRDFNSELKAKVEELTKANEEWAVEYGKLNHAYQEKRTGLDQALKPSPAAQKRATTAPTAKGKGKR